MAKSRKKKNIIMGVLTHIWLTLSVIVILIPVLWMIFTSFTKGSSLVNIPAFPNKTWHFSLEHYNWIFTHKSGTQVVISDFVDAFTRTLLVALLNTFCVVILSVFTGYAITRFRFKGKKQLLLTFMAFQMFPSFMAMFAYFLFFRQFGLLNHPLALVFIYATGAIPFNTFIYRGYMRNIPRSLDDAAAIDGASNMQRLFKLIIPLSMPIIGFLAVNAFMAPWLDYILPKVLLTSQDKVTVALLLYRTTDPVDTMYYNPLTFMAGALLLAVPIMIVNFFMQKYIVYGLTSGAEKG